MPGTEPDDGGRAVVGVQTYEDVKMGNAPQYWLVWIGREMNRLRECPEALARLGEYAREVAGSNARHATVVRCVDDAPRTPAEKAVMLVRLHDHYDDATAAPELKEVAGLEGWTPLLPLLGLTLEQEISVAAFAVHACGPASLLSAEYGAKCGEYLSALFEEFGMAAAEAPARLAEIVGPSEAAVRAYRSSQKRKAGKGGRKRNTGCIEFQCRTWARWLRERDSYAAPSTAGFCKSVIEEYRLEVPFTAKDLDNCRRAYERYPEHR